MKTPHNGIFVGMLGAGAMAAVMALGGTGAQAGEEFPTESLAWVLPFGAGGGSDRWVRVMATGAEDAFGVSWRVENRPGAGATAGWQHVLEQEADGYTVFFASPTPVLTLLQEVDHAIDPEDIEIVGFVSAFRSILVTKEDRFPDWDSFLEATQEEPLVLGGTISLLMGVANILDQAGAEAIYVPYDSTGEAVTDFLGDHIDAAAVTGSTAMTIVPDEAVAIINTSDIALSEEALEQMGEVPEAEQRGFEGMSFPRWVGVHPDTPQDRADRLGELLGDLMAHEGVTSTLERMGEEIIYVPRDEARERYSDLVARMRASLELLE